MAKFTILPLSIFLLALFLCTESSEGSDAVAACGLPLVKRDQRTPIVVTEYGEISAVEINCGGGRPYRLHFITLEPNAVMLPVLLHSDMVLFVHTGSGVLTWVDEGNERRIGIRRGDIYRLRYGTVFYARSNLEMETREKLRIYAIFSNTEEGFYYDPCIGPYSSIRKLLSGFDKRILQSAFAVPEELIETIRNAEKPPLIVHALPKNKTKEPEDHMWQLESRFLKTFVWKEYDLFTDPINGKKKKKKQKKPGTYNVFEAEPDFENCNGRSITVNKNDLQILKGSNIGVFMVNLTKGSMMGPHWNPTACEISIVIHGGGMIRVVGGSNEKDGKCRNMRLMVEEGDVFVVHRFRPMAQMSFNNNSFVFIGFSTSMLMNYPQFLAGKSSVMQALGGEMVATSFNVSKRTVERLLGPQEEAVILDCTSCAEVELAKLKEEIEREREEERRREEEERKRREEEERRRREEEERRRREEEERRRREEEEEEEEGRKREEEAKRQEEEREREEERRREEEERKRREEEERRRREEEEERKREEEERRRRRREEEEEERREEERERKAREEEEAARRRREEERQRREREEEAEREGEEPGPGESEE